MVNRSGGAGTAQASFAPKLGTLLATQHQFHVDFPRTAVQPETQGIHPVCLRAADQERPHVPRPLRAPHSSQHFPSRRQQPRRIHPRPRRKEKPSFAIPRPSRNRLGPRARHEFPDPTLERRTAPGPDFLGQHFPVRRTVDETSAATATQLVEHRFFVPQTLCIKFAVRRRQTRGLVEQLGQDRAPRRTVGGRLSQRQPSGLGIADYADRDQAFGDAEDPRRRRRRIPLPLENRPPSLPDQQPGLTLRRGISRSMGQSGRRQVCRLRHAGREPQREDDRAWCHCSPARRRPAKARAKVSSSACSNPPPAGMPCARRETRTPRGARRSAR